MLRRALPSLLLVACSSSITPPGDAGSRTDATLADAADLDAARDAARDADLDADLDAARDADLDADLDAGTPPLPPPSCDDAVEDVYVTPPDLLPGTAADRGAIVRCATEPELAASSIALGLSRAGVLGVEPVSGAQVYRVAYRTTRRSPTGPGGEAWALGTAWVVVPDTLVASPAPLVVAAHGTAGIADVCAPSRYPQAGDALVLPWVARGFPVIAPDYAGLGNEGIQGYGDNDDTARSVLDAARALLAFLPAGTLSGQVILSGHSQGGGAVLSSHARSGTYGAGLDIALVVPFAPGWPVERNVDGYRFPGVPTTFGGGAPAAIAALFLYAWHGRTFGDERAGDGFPAGRRDALTTALERDCVFQLAASIPAAAPTFGDLVAPELRAGLLACADGGTCAGNARLLWEFLDANILRVSADGPPVLAFAGTADTLATPAEIGCIVRHLEEDGITPRVCVDTSSHFDIVARNAAFAVDYAEAVLSGASPPDCLVPLTLPACTR